MNDTIIKAIAKAKEMYVYESSEQPDEDKLEYPFDGIWCAMYDVCKLYHLGIIDDVEVEEFNEAKAFLLETQLLTHDFKEKTFEF